MNQTMLYSLWAMLFTFCAVLGFLPEPEGALRILLTVLSIGFFLPPALLLYGAKQRGDRSCMKLVRNLSAASLLLTAGALMAGILTAVSSEAMGRFVHGVLTVVSTPMLCSGMWAVSLFLWACLMLTASAMLKK